MQKMKKEKWKQKQKSDDRRERVNQAKKTLD